VIKGIDSPVFALSVFPEIFPVVLRKAACVVPVVTPSRQEIRTTRRNKYLIDLSVPESWIFLRINVMPVMLFPESIFLKESRFLSNRPSAVSVHHHHDLYSSDDYFNNIIFLEAV
jgi:hypothetical protein